MISVAHGIEYRKNNIIFFVGTEEIPCPVCGGELGVRGTCTRKVRRKEGDVIYRLRVMKCKKCGKTHRELPKGIVPYKRMDAEMLGIIAEDDGKADLDAPSISTWDRIRRWVLWFLAYAQHILNGLKSSLGQSFTTIPSGSSLRQQLAYSVRLVVNSGNWIQHRSVMRAGF